MSLLEVLLTEIARYSYRQGCGLQDSYAWFHDDEDQVSIRALLRSIANDEVNKLVEILKKKVDERIPKHGTETKTGGIDLTPANMNLQTKNSGEDIKFHMDPAMLSQLQNAQGFSPVIINIQPLDSLPNFLGLNQKPNQ